MYLTLTAAREVTSMTMPSKSKVKPSDSVIRLSHSSGMYRNPDIFLVQEFLHISAALEDLQQASTLSCATSKKEDIVKEREKNPHTQEAKQH